MKVLKLAFLVTLATCWSSTCPAQEAKAVISGTQTAAAGDLIVLDASGSQADCYHWVLVNSKRAFLPVDGGRQLVFSSGVPQEYIFVLVVGVCRNGQELKVDMAEHRVVVGQFSPPSPALPQGKWGFAAATYRWVTELVPAESQHFATSLAQNFESQAAAVEAGTFDNSSPEEAIRKANLELQTANRASLGYVDSSRPGDAPKWAPFFSQWKQKADLHNAASENDSAAGPPLRTVRDYAQAYRETAAGLKAAVAGRL